MEESYISPLPEDFAQAMKFIEGRTKCRRTGLLALVLAPAWPKHEFADGFARIFPLLEDQFHLLGDGHFDVVFAGEAQCGAGGQHTFSHLSAQALKDLRQLAPLAQRLADSAVAGEGSGAGQHRS